MPQDAVTVLGTWHVGGMRGGGSSSFYTGNRLEQLFLGGLAGTQYRILGRARFALAGRVRLGLDPQGPIS